MKKILALSLACVLLLALCACGEEEQTSTTTPTTIPTTIPTTAPVTMTEEEAKQIASELLGKYAKFGAVPVCCETEYVHADMSAFLTDAQKEIYIGSQHKILCCKSAAEVNAHIDRTMVPALSCNYPDDLLFSDDEGNMYVIIYPTEHSHYENHRVVSFDNSTIVLEADDTIEIEVGQRRTQQDEMAGVSFDGDSLIKLGVGERVLISKSDSVTKICKINRMSFLEILRRKMNTTY